MHSTVKRKLNGNLNKVLVNSGVLRRKIFYVLIRARRAKVRNFEKLHIRTGRL